MQFNWRNAEGTQQEKPKELDTTLSPHAVYVRKNIKQETKEQTDGNTVKVWTYKEAILTPKEYEQYQKELAECESMAQQELVDSNLVVMGAIADSTEMGENMVQLYVALIKAGRKTLDDVPEKYREAVKKELGA